MTKRSAKGRALFYTRDSGGKHETTPSEYVNWAIGQTANLGLQFTGTPSSIHAMIRDQQSVDGDIFLDYGVPGNILSRPGLNALIETAKTDLQVSHILIPRRDRLFRPDDAIVGMKFENDLCRLGLTLVFMDGVSGPLGPRERQTTGDGLMAFLAYDRAGQDRRDLAQKVIHAQLSLAKSGYSSGGEPPYGFRRWLVKEDGTRIRQLAKGEIVRMRGHHVVWAPTQENEMEVIRRILDLLPTHSANQVAKILTTEKIPTPDHGRFRTDNGVRHPTSGIWHQNTVTSIARNPLLIGMVEYGRRSMGDQLRPTTVTLPASFAIQRKA